MCDHTEDSQHARHVDGSALEQQGIKVPSGALGGEVRERVRGDREQRTHRTGRVEVVAQGRVDGGLVAEEGGMQLALGFPPNSWRLLPIRIAQHGLDLVKVVLERRLLRLHLAHCLIGEVHALIPRL